MRHTENFVSFEQDDGQNDAVVDAVEDYSSPHLGSNNVLVSSIWHSFQQFVNRRLSRQSQGSQCVHDQVDPKHLDGSEGRLLQDDCSGEGHHDSHAVDSQLELKELSDAVEDVSTVLDCCDD